MAEPITLLGVMPPSSGDSAGPPGSAGSEAATGPGRRLLLATIYVGIALALVGALFTRPIVGVGLGAAAVIGPIALLRPRVALLLLVAVTVTNTSTVVGERGGIGLYLMALILALASLVLGVARGELRPAWSPVFLLAALFVGTRALSLLWASDPGAGLPVVVSAAKDSVFLVVVTMLLSGTSGGVRVTRLVVACIALLAAVTLVNEFVLHNATELAGFSRVPLTDELGAATSRHSGPEEDPNFWARSLVLFLPLALSLAAADSTRRRRMWALAAAAMVGAVYLTQSRGGFIACAAAALAWLALAGARYRKLLVAVPVAGVVILLAVPGISSRLLTLRDLGSSGGQSGDPSLAGRVASQRTALDMFLDHPGTGVGAGNFEVLQPEYRRREGLAAKPVAPHNTYLELASEGGVLGLLGWLAFYGGAAFVALRALVVVRRLEPSPGRSQMAVCLVGVLAALVGWGVASAFLPLGGFRNLLTVVALAAAVDIEMCRQVRGGRDGLPARHLPAQVAAAG